MEIKTLNLLIVEDDVKNLYDAFHMLDHEEIPYESEFTGHTIPEDQQMGIPFHIKVTNAWDLEDALPLIETADLIMSDIFIPENRESDRETGPHGQQIAEQALKLGKPIVLVTSTYHHGKKTQPVNRWATSKGMELFDTSNRDETDNQKIKKPWRSAFYGLLYIYFSPSFGQVEISDQGMFIQYPDTSRSWLGQEARRFGSRFCSYDRNGRYQTIQPIDQHILGLGFGKQYAEVRDRLDCFISDDKKAASINGQEVHRVQENGELCSMAVSPHYVCWSADWRQINPDNSTSVTKTQLWLYDLEHQELIKLFERNLLSGSVWATWQDEHTLLITHLHDDWSESYETIKLP